VFDIDSETQASHLFGPSVGAGTVCKCSELPHAVEKDLRIEDWLGNTSISAPSIPLPLPLPNIPVASYMSSYVPTAVSMSVGMSICDSHSVGAAHAPHTTLASNAGDAGQMKTPAQVSGLLMNHDTPFVPMAYLMSTPMGMPPVPVNAIGMVNQNSIPPY
jgi:hypothetical protein